MTGKEQIDPFSLGQGKKLMDWLNASADFQGATKWFYGSILLVSDGNIMWLKVYSGRVIDVPDKPSPFGFTFALRATGEDWTRLLKAERNELLAFELKTLPGVGHFPMVEFDGFANLVAEFLNRHGL